MLIKTEKPHIAVIDADLYKYHVAAAGETRTVLVTHRASGKEMEVKNRTEFYGDWRKKEGGILATINAKRTSPFTWDEFDYKDIQVAEPIENVLHTAKVMVEKDLEASGCSEYIAYLGAGDSFRVARSSLIKYKDREHLLKPLLLQEVSDYLQCRFEAEIVVDIEADDKIVMECYNEPHKFAIVEDKDAWAQPINVWDRNQQHRGIVNCNEFGKLFLDDKGKVRGQGRLFLYWQTAYGDDTDNYRANCMSDKKWGEKSAFNALVTCQDDKEAMQALKDIYQSLYPEPKEVIGWRGDPILIDWKYVIREIWDMARMLRWKDDKVDIIRIMEKVGVKTE